ncbi:hypothetical protein FGO68_gene4212 [Halteria grandinella]|uniref:Uncharacterized protein n=1 Tax=Halteria grandinella TaxID=5974 RepID=A0A8J8P298_HALGN|nr:hypothetical protein FGO68_gene4212 [Halteria grandinella]
MEFNLIWDLQDTTNAQDFENPMLLPKFLVCQLYQSDMSLLTQSINPFCVKVMAKTIHKPLCVKSIY